ncbi:hypothetical protein Ahy_A02g007307 [Arachis hypogaea]|uniref:Uncharacterized protein n=1 Tax=Arachis hypogaea TaxID=3818 RepID=A0A445EBX9_ARAHY|nr:hypothetical protein Ahy_A02g007307 [Arachis hypogaea]
MSMLMLLAVFPGKHLAFCIQPTQVPGGIGRLERPPALGAFNLPGRQQLGPPHGFSFGMNQPLLPNLAIPEFGPGQAKLLVMPVHPFLATQQQHPPNEMGFMLPRVNQMWSLFLSVITCPVAHTKIS